ncbi:MAG: prepilin peptidase [Firmicutes bacterium]|nr:prepilin peptidase [Bacillota bacterium]
MGDELIRTMIICSAAVAAGVLAGNGAVYFFNKMPGTWLVDYGEEPDEELLHPTVQRVKSTPWKYLFTGFFIVIGIKMAMEDPMFAVPAIAAIWLLLEMAIADAKYMIVPDQLIMLLVVCGLGFIPHHALGVMDCLRGALIGFGVMLVIALIGRVAYKKPAVGGADVKLFAALGLCCGTDGVLVIFLLTTFISAGHFIWLMARRGAKLSDERAMVPYIAFSATLYLVIFHEMSYNIMIQF